MTITPDRTDDLNGALVFDSGGPLLPHIPTYRIESIEGNVIEVIPTYQVDPGQVVFPTGQQMLEAVQEAYQAILEQPHYIQAQRVIDWQRAEEQRRREMRMDRDHYRDYMDREHYCYCSPGRGQFFDRYRDGQRRAYIDRLMEWPEPVTYTAWVPEPKPVPVMSKELVVIPKPVLDPVEVIPAPKRSRVPQLAMLGAMVMTVCAFAFDIAAALVL